MNLVFRLKELVRQERELSVEILKLLIYVEDTRLYAELGHKNMHAFCMDELGYPPASADRRVQSMRLMRAEPQVEEKLANGELNLTTASTIQRTATEARRQNVVFPTAQVIEAVSGETTRQAEKTIFREAKAAGMTVKEDPMEEMMLDLLAYYSHRNLRKDEILLMLVKKEHERILPSRERRASATGKEQDPEDRRVCPRLRREVLVRDRSQCTFVSANGRRCTATHHLQVDHIVPVALGGLTKLSNLRLLCRTHNLLEARRAGLLRPCERSRPNSSGAGNRKPHRAGGAGGAGVRPTARASETLRC